MKEGEVKVVDKRMSAVEKEAVSTEPNAVILKAMDKGYSPELIEKMMDLQERHEKNVAKKAYTAAMAEFKKDPPKIMKEKSAGFQAAGQSVGYSYADLAVASEQINKALSENGLSAGWKTNQENGGITVTCTITHELGHSESTSLSAEPDTTGAKNAIQAVGSTITYLERYTLFALTGLAAHGQDDDGDAGGGQAKLVTKGEVKAMQKIIDEKQIDTDLFFTFVSSAIAKSEITTLEEIPKAHFKEVMSALKKRKKPEREPGSDDS